MLGGSTNSFCEKIPEIVIALNILYTEIVDFRFRKELTNE